MTDLELAILAKRAYDDPDVVVDNAKLAFAEGDGEIGIAAAGTDDATDMLMNLWAVPWRPDCLDAWVHRGFWLYTKKLIRPVMDMIYTTGLAPRFTGHSLGAAAVGNLAAYCMRMGIKPAGLTTFGSPRVGFSSYCDVTKQIPGMRYVKEGDRVSWVPPPGIIMPWRHDRDATELPGEEGIIDHPIEGYIDSLS